MGSGASVIGGMNIVLGGDGATFSQSIERAQAQLNKLKGVTGDFAKTSENNFSRASKSAEQFGHSSVTSVQAASGFLRELNGDITNNIRAVERFITTIPGIGAALKAIYPAVGALAVAGVLYEGIKRAKEFIETLNKVPDALKLGFREITADAQLSNDQLRLSNDRLQNEIDKLAGRPQNNLAIAIDETRIASDKLSKSIGESTKRVAELLKQNSIGIAGAFMRKDETVGLAGSLNSFEKDRGNLAFAQNQAVRTGDTAKAEDLGKQLAAKTAAELQYALSDIAKRTGTEKMVVGRNRVEDVPYARVHGDQAAPLAIDQGIVSMIQAQQDQEQEEARNAKLVPAKAGAEASVESAKKAAQDRLRAMQVELAQKKQQGADSIGYEFRFWADRIDAFKKGSAQYADIEEKMGSLALERARQVSEKIKAFKSDQLRSSAELPAEKLSANKAIIDVQRDLDVETEKHSNSLAVMNDVLAEGADKLKEQQVGFDLASGSITRHDAAIRLATLHMSQYQAQLAKLDQEARNDAANSSLTPDQRRDNQDRRNQQRAGIISASATAAAADQQTIGDTSIIGASTNALQEFIAATRNSAAQIKNFTDESLGAFNDQVIKSLTTRDHSSRREFSNLGAGIFRSGASTGLSKLEGSLLSMTGLGGGKKPTGAAGDPLHVVMENSALSTGTGLLNSLFGGAGAGASSLASGVTSDVGDFAASDAFSGGGAALADIIPFFGDGGAFSANTLALVGDRGPELVNFGSAGHVISNNNVRGALRGAAGGSGDTHNWNIDARGATDPALVRMMVMQGIKQAEPHLSRMANARQNDMNRRRPSIHR